MKSKPKRRNVMFIGKTVPTADPADWIIGRERRGVWMLICRGSIVTFDPANPKEFNVERMTKEQVADRMAFYKQHGQGILRKLKPVLFDEFNLAIDPTVHFHEVASVEDGREADERELRQLQHKRAKERRDTMRSLFNDRGHS